MLKRRYLDYFKKSGLDLNRPGFGSLRKFVVEELSIMTSDYAETFFESDDKEKLRESRVGRGSVCVRQVEVKAPVVQTSQTNNKGLDLRNNSRGNQRPQLTKLHPPCFVCNDSVLKHILGDCETFKTFTNTRKKRVVVGAGRCETAWPLRSVAGAVARSTPAGCISFTSGFVLAAGTEVSVYQK